MENPDEQAVFEVIVSTLESVHAAILKLDARIGVFVNENDRVTPLLSIPYVGPITAGTLASELGDVHRFRNAKAVASYAGLVPESNNLRTTNTTEGSCSMAIGSYDTFSASGCATSLRHPLVKVWAESRLSRMPKNKVRVALARKLLVGVWHTMRTGEVFSLQRCLATA